MADLSRSTGAAPARIDEFQTDVESLPSLFGRLGEDIMTLVDVKLSLLKVEVKEDADAYIRSGSMIGVGAIVAAVGFALINVAVALLVSTLFTFSAPVNYALGFIITGAVYMLIGSIIIKAMSNRLAKVDPVPHESVEELRKDKLWLKKEI
jgi:uncharacterized membrane protein YqjE